MWAAEMASLGRERALRPCRCRAPASILFLPAGSKRALEHGKLVDEVGERRQSARGFLDLDLGAHLPEPAPWLEIGEIVHHLVDSGVDGFQILGVERAAFGVAL